MLLNISHVSLPAVADVLDRRNPHPEVLHTFDRAKAEAFAARERKRRNTNGQPSREVSVSRSILRVGDRLVVKFHVLSAPVVREPEVQFGRHDRPFFNDADLVKKHKKSSAGKKCDGACCM